jgi:hypothetical protein
MGVYFDSRGYRRRVFSYINPLFGHYEVLHFYATQNIGIFWAFFLMLRRLWSRVYLDIEHKRLWLDGSWQTVYQSKDGYVCPHLSVEDVSRVSPEDLPKRITLEVDVPVKLSSVDVTLYVERGVVELYVDVEWSYWSYAVGKREFIDKLTTANAGRSRVLRTTMALITASSSLIIGAVLSTHLKTSSTV